MSSSTEKKARNKRSHSLFSAKKGAPTRIVNWMGLRRLPTSPCRRREKKTHPYNPESSQLPQSKWSSFSVALFSSFLFPCKWLRDPVLFFFFFLDFCAKLFDTFWLFPLLSLARSKSKAVKLLLGRSRSFALSPILLRRKFWKTRMSSILGRGS